ISGDDQMKYDKTELKVKAGQKVKLTLTHIGKMPKDAMGHNWVLLNQGVDLAAFAAEAIKAKDNDYIPAGKEGDIVAHTKTIGGGESTSVEFDAPAAGTYEFLCSFPGHSGMMKGHFIVE
ncbi:MAG TPA: azurin, partial [Saprospiraceae bacterium]|nr:azurin [Saprospiraceae bacterium]